MDNTGIIVGLDIGTTKICAIVGAKNSYGKIDILGVGKSPSEGVVRGVVTNIDKTVQSIKKAVDEASRASNVEISHVHVGIAGQHIKSHQHRGSIVRREAESEISTTDINRMLEDMHNVAMSPGEKIIHIIPQEYTVDGDFGIKDPIGMSGVKLEGNFHIITGQITAAKNIYRCVEKAGLKVVGITLEPIASSAAVLSEEEKEAGVALVDIGGGTTDIAIFQEGIIRHTAVIPLGGNIITEDIKQGCTVMQKQAEAMKVQFGNAWAEDAKISEIISIPGLTGREPREISRRNLAHIIQARVEEIFEHVHYEIKSSAFEQKLIGGVVLTGGGSMLKNMSHLVEYVTGIDTRVGSPGEHLGSSLTEKVNSPIYATGLGLVVNAFDQNLSAVGNKQSEQEKTVKPKAKLSLGSNSFFDKFKHWLKDDIEDFNN
ncbi:MAG: cell division protein FtsA [Bacteroidia bacterium]